MSYSKLLKIEKRRITQLKTIIRSLKADQLLQNLVNIPSTSGNEYEAACFLEKYLISKQVKVRRQNVGLKRFNLVASIGRRTTRPSILFNTHIDTVPAFGKQTERPKLRGKILYGRGTCDTKGSVVAMATAFLALAQLEPAEQPHVTFAVMVGEENSGDGVARFTRAPQTFSWAVVGEPTGLRIAHTQSGYLEVTVEAFAPPCHGFEPVNEQAIIALSALLQECHKLVTDLSREYPHHLFVKSFNGGSNDSFWYTRPHASAQVLINAYPDANQKCVIEKIRAIAKKIERLYKGTRLRIDVTDSDNGFTTSKLAQSVRSLATGIRLVGKEPRLSHLPSWTDGSTLSEMGIETVIFGPGDLRNAHTSRECISVPDVETAAIVLALSCLVRDPEK